MPLPYPTEVYSFNIDSELLACLKQAVQRNNRGRFISLAIAKQLYAIGAKVPSQYIIE